MKGARHIPRVNKNIVPKASSGFSASQAVGAISPAVAMIPGAGPFISAGLGIVGGVADAIVASKRRKMEQFERAQEAANKHALQAMRADREDASIEREKYLLEQADSSDYNSWHRQFHGLKSGGEVPRAMAGYPLGYDENAAEAYNKVPIYKNPYAYAAALALLSAGGVGAYMYLNRDQDEADAYNSEGIPDEHLYITQLVNEYNRQKQVAQNRHQAAVQKYEQSMLEHNQELSNQTGWDMQSDFDENAHLYDNDTLGEDNKNSAIDWYENTYKPNVSVAGNSLQAAINDLNAFPKIENWRQSLDGTNFLNNLKTQRLQTVRRPQVPFQSENRINAENFLLDKAKNNKFLYGEDAPYGTDAWMTTGHNKVVKDTIARNKALEDKRQLLRRDYLNKESNRVAFYDGLKYMRENGSLTKDEYETKAQQFENESQRLLRKFQQDLPHPEGIPYINDWHKTPEGIKHMATAFEDRNFLDTVRGSSPERVAGLERLRKKFPEFMPLFDQAWGDVDAGRLGLVPQALESAQTLGSAYGGPVPRYESGGDAYDYDGNTAKTSGIMNNPLAKTLMRVGSFAVPSSLALWRPLLGNALNSAVSFGSGNMWGGLLSGGTLIGGALAGKNPLTEPGIAHGAKSLYDVFNKKWTQKLSSLGGISNLYTGGAMMAPIFASWAMPKVYQPTLGLNNRLFW